MVLAAGNFHVVKLSLSKSAYHLKRAASLTLQLLVTAAR